MVRKLRDGERLLNEGKDLVEVLPHLEISEATWNRIDRGALERELSRLLRRDLDAPVVFHPAMDLSTRGGSSWATTLGFVLDEIRQGSESLDHPLVQTRVEQLIIDQLLLAQPHN